MVTQFECSFWSYSVTNWIRPDAIIKHSTINRRWVSPHDSWNSARARLREWCYARIGITATELIVHVFDFFARIVHARRRVPRYCWKRATTAPSLLEIFKCRAARSNSTDTCQSTNYPRANTYTLVGPQLSRVGLQWSKLLAWHWKRMGWLLVLLLSCWTKQPGRVLKLQCHLHACCTGWHASATPNAAT